MAGLIKKPAKRRRTDTVSSSEDFALVMADAQRSTTPKPESFSISAGASVTSEPVMILVGEDQEEFFVHKHHLMTSSKYFEKLLSVTRKLQIGNTGGAFRTVKLEDANTTAFALFSKWLYSGQFHIPRGTSSKVEYALHASPHWDEIVLCYNLSVALEASGFGDATIDALIQHMKIFNNSIPSLAKWVYECTKKDSVHRLLCRDIVVRTWDRSKFSTLWKEDYPREFIDSVLEEVGSNLDSGIKRQSVVGFLASKGPCAYHEHERLGEPCYKVAFGG